MKTANSAFEHWRASLIQFLNWFEKTRRTTQNFYLKTFAFFIVLNLFCYFLALLTTYPGHLFGYKGIEYWIMSLPVGFLGALFDSLSLFVTIFIVKRAIRAEDKLVYISYLSVDLLIAILASLWVLFVFMISGWLVSYVLGLPETIGSRFYLYEGRVAGALSHPLSPDSLRHIFFGMVMGASALLPTLLHVFMAGRSAVTVLSTSYKRRYRD